MWLRRYSGSELRADGVAAVIVTLMLIPQSLAYAMLAGLPPEAGLYASILPLVGYAIFGTSRTLAVGPVAIVSLMTASAVAGMGIADPAARAAAALVLAVLVGLFLLLAGLFRLGFLANLLSHPVITGFISASGILIGASQLGPILGIEGGGEGIVERIMRLVEGLPQTNPVTAAIGGGALAFLLWTRWGLGPLLQRMGMAAGPADLTVRAAPAAAVVVTTLLAAGLNLAETAGLNVVGRIPSGLPPLIIPETDPELWTGLASAALLIALVGFVESISVAQSFAAKRRETVDPDQELIGLGAANIAAGFSGGYPVTGGFSRSAVSFAAGARTPLAGVLTAVFIGLVALALTPWFYHLPRAVLSATIVAAVVPLIDLKSFRRAWGYNKADGIAEIATAVVVLFIGIEAGIATGVGLSLALYIWRTSRPHMAVVGQVPGTEHYRNIERHEVITQPGLLAVRVDESLYFVNARYLEDRVLGLVTEGPDVDDVVLICSAVNFIDASALESLMRLNDRLKDAGVRLHLTEVKGPVMDRLHDTDFLKTLTGDVFLSTHEAFESLGSQE